MMKDMPTRLIMVKTAKAQKPVLASAEAIRKVPNAKQASPARIGMWSGRRSAARPVSGSAKTSSRPAGMSSSPALVAVKLCTCWTKTGMT